MSFDLRVPHDAPITPYHFFVAIQGPLQLGAPPLGHRPLVPPEEVHQLHFLDQERYFAEQADILASNVFLQWQSRAFLKSREAALVAVRTATTYEDIIETLLVVGQDNDPGQTRAMIPGIEMGYALNCIRQVLDLPPLTNRTSAKLEEGALLLGTFRLGAIIGEGAAGRVHQAQVVGPWPRLEIGASVAIKVYKRELAEREPTSALRRRRAREAHVGGKGLHPNLVRVFGATEDFLIMELLHGTSVRGILDLHYDLRRELILPISIGLAEAMNALHTSGILHRDIKPENAFLTTDKRTILLDLGVCRPLREKTFTRSRAFLGSAHYSAPEWLLEGQCTKASDVYSLGGIILSLLIGKRLYDDVIPWARLPNAVAFDEPLSAFPAPAECRGIESLARRMLAKDPRQRPKLMQVRRQLELISKAKTL